MAERPRNLWPDTISRYAVLRTCPRMLLDPPPTGHEVLEYWILSKARDFAHLAPLSGDTCWLSPPSLSKYYPRFCHLDNDIHKLSLYVSCQWQRALPVRNPLWPPAQPTFWHRRREVDNSSAKLRYPALINLSLCSRRSQCLCFTLFPNALLLGV